MCWDRSWDKFTSILYRQLEAPEPYRHHDSIKQWNSAEPFLCFKENNHCGLHLKFAQWRLPFSWSLTSVSGTCSSQKETIVTMQWTYQRSGGLCPGRQSGSQRSRRKTLWITTETNRLFWSFKISSQGLKDRTLVVIIPVQHNTIDHWHPLTTSDHSILGPASASSSSSVPKRWILPSALQMQVDDPLTVVTSIGNPSVACELRVVVERFKSQATNALTPFIAVFHRVSCLRCSACYTILPHRTTLHLWQAIHMDGFNYKTSNKHE